MNRPALLVFDKNERILSWSSELESITGYTSSTVVGKHLESVCPVLSRMARDTLQEGLRSTTLDLFVQTEKSARYWAETGLIEGIGGWISLQPSHDNEVPLNQVLHAVLEDMPHLVWALDSDMNMVYANSRLREYIEFRYPKDDVYSKWERAVHPDDLDAVLNAWEKAWENRLPFRALHRMKRPHEDEYRWLVVYGTPIKRMEGQIPSWIGIATDVHEHRLNVLRLEQLQIITSALSKALTPQEVASVVITHGITAMGAQNALAAVFNPDKNTLNIIGYEGYPISMKGRWMEFPVSPSMPMGYSVLTGQPLFFASRNELIERFPETRVVLKECSDQALVVAPLQVDGRPIGAISFAYQKETPVDHELANFALTLANQCAQALQRTFLFEAERSARRLAESERTRLYQILDQIPASIGITTGPEHTLEFTNKSFRADHLSFPAARGALFHETYQRIYESHAMEIADHVFKSGEPFLIQEKSVPSQDENGSKEPQFWTSLLLPWKNDEGATQGLLSYAFEVTDQVLARRKIEISESRLRLALGAANLGIWEWDVKNNSFWHSGTYEKIFGLHELPETWNLESFVETIHPDDRDEARAKINAFIGDSTRHYYEHEWRILRPDGETCWVQDRGQVYRDSKGGLTKVLGICLDITSLKKAEEALKKAKDEAEAADRAKTAFVANMSHEFRTPLSAILGFAEFLGKPDLEQTKRNSYVEGIRRNGQALVKLLEDILDLSRVEAGQVAVDIQPFNPRALLDDVIDLFRDEAERKGVKIRTRHAASIPNLFSSDPIRVRQILINLIGNAVKFTDSGCVEVRMEVKPRSGSNATPPFLEFNIQDTGIGLSPEQTTKLFQPFGQADQSTHRKYGGTGLGLFISRRLAEALGGNVELLKSGPGEGSTFLVRLADFYEKQQKGAGLIVPGSYPETSSSGFPRTELQGTRILIVEDTHDIRDFLKSFFESTGVHIELAADGRQGVAMATQAKFDAILMDLHMPEMDGYLATEALRQNGFRNPIIAITARAQPEDRAKCFEIGFDAYLTKPLHMRELETTLKRLLKRQAGS